MPDGGPADPAVLREGTTQLYVAVTRLARSLRRQCRPAGIGASGISVLVTLDGSGPLRVSTLASSENITAAAASRIVLGLTEAGYVRTVRDPADGRARLISATTAGRDFLHTMHTRQASTLHYRFTHLPPARQHAVLAALDALEELSCFEPTEHADPQDQNTMPSTIGLS